MDADCVLNEGCNGTFHCLMQLEKFIRGRMIGQGYCELFGDGNI